MILAEFSISPMDKGASLSDDVAHAIDLIDKSGLPYRLGPMGTCVEGEWDEVMALIKKCYLRMKKDCARINCSIKIDAREGGGGRLTQKIDTIETKVGRKLQR